APVAGPPSTSPGPSGGRRRGRIRARRCCTATRRRACRPAPPPRSVPPRRRGPPASGSPLADTADRAACRAPRRRPRPPRPERPPTGPGTGTPSPTRGTGRPGQTPQRPPNRLRTSAPLVRAPRRTSPNPSVAQCAPRTTPAPADPPDPSWVRILSHRYGGHQRAVHTPRGGRCSVPDPLAVSPAGLHTASATLNEHAQTELSLEGDAALPPSGRRPTPENAAAAA